MNSARFQAAMRWGGMLVTLLAFILIPFALFFPATESLSRDMLSSPEMPVVVALAGVFLLSLDLFLPVPSRLISPMGGSLLGFLAGTLVSFAGMTLACALGWLFGRHVGQPGAVRMLGCSEYRRLQKLSDRYGSVALVLCRPIPVAAEASVIMAGASGQGLRQTTAACAMSNLGISALYAAAGAYALATQSFLVVFLAAILLPGLFLMLYRLRTSTVGNRHKRA